MKTAALMVVASLAGTAASGAAEPARLPNLRDIVACRALTDSAARLACYDGKVAALDDAERRRDIAIVDTRAEQQRRRAEFGAIGRSGGGDAAPISEISTTLRAAAAGSTGAFVFTLADGGRWMQVDDAPIAGRMRAGEAVTVRRTMLGGYKLTVGKRASVKVRRL